MSSLRRGSHLWRAPRRRGLQLRRRALRHAAAELPPGVLRCNCTCRITAGATALQWPSWRSALRGKGNGPGYSRVLQAGVLKGTTGRGTQGVTTGRGTQGVTTGRGTQGGTTVRGTRHARRAPRAQLDSLMRTQIRVGPRLIGPAESRRRSIDRCGKEAAAKSCDGEFQGC